MVGAGSRRVGRLGVVHLPDAGSVRRRGPGVRRWGLWIGRRGGTGNDRRGGHQHGSDRLNGPVEQHHDVVHDLNYQYDDYDDYDYDYDDDNNDDHNSGSGSGGHQVRSRPSAGAPDRPGAPAGR